MGGAIVKLKAVRGVEDSCHCICPVCAESKIIAAREEKRNRDLIDRKLEAKTSQPGSHAIAVDSTSYRCFYCGNSVRCAEVSTLTNDDAEIGVENRAPTREPLKTDATVPEQLPPPSNSQPENLSPQTNCNKVEPRSNRETNAALVQFQNHIARMFPHLNSDGTPFIPTPSSDEMNPATLFHLPTEVFLHHLVSFLEWHELFRFSRASREIYRSIHKNDVAVGSSALPGDLFRASLQEPIYRLLLWTTWRIQAVDRTGDETATRKNSVTWMCHMPLNSGNLPTKTSMLKQLVQVNCNDLRTRTAKEIFYNISTFKLEVFFPLKDQCYRLGSDVLYVIRLRDRMTSYADIPRIITYARILGHSHPLGNDNGWCDGVADLGYDSKSKRAGGTPIERNVRMCEFADLEKFFMTQVFLSTQEQNNASNLLSFFEVCADPYADARRVQKRYRKRVERGRTESTNYLSKLKKIRRKFDGSGDYYWAYFERKLQRVGLCIHSDLRTIIMYYEWEFTYF